MENKEIIGWIGMLLATFWAGEHLPVAIALTSKLGPIVGAFVGMFAALSIISALIFLLNWKKYYMPNLVFWILMFILLLAGYVGYLAGGNISALFANQLAEYALVIDILNIILAFAIWKVDAE
ncbi:hypothetical protein MJ1_0372 [Nanobdella aerobiophila]|uniref:Uncharacterized protein n=1 Tax=Nanobdella aerobiophila TaxID=2586965 RepID=A0A915WS48_9ARCH|nr:hypothetical protein [Nanobdella aerobiophila]BBL45536.1 hypothetical protein MJ1_0372 [Nanobdella aerobiophila]